MPNAAASFIDDAHDRLVRDELVLPVRIAAGRCIGCGERYPQGRDTECDLCGCAVITAAVIQRPA